MADLHIHLRLKKQHLIVFISLIVILGIVLVTNAYAPGESADPGIMGHSANELEVDIGGNPENVQNLFNSILDNSGNINYANTAGAVEWNDVNNKPNVATETWVSNNYATESYVDSNSGSFEWSEVPSGTHCGVYMMTQGTLQAYEPCQGHNPRNSCPSGFKRADLGYFEASSGDRKLVFCIKD